MLSFLLGSNTSNALEYIIINAENNRFFDCNRRTGCDPFNKISRTFPSTFWSRPLFPFRPVRNFGWMDRAQYFHYFRMIDRLSLFSVFRSTHVISRESDQLRSSSHKACFQVINLAGLQKGMFFLISWFVYLLWFSNNFA